MNVIDKANAYIGHPKEVDEGYEVSMRRDAYVKGYQDAKRDIINKACKWIKKEVLDDYQGVIWGNIVKDFRKAMEE